MSGQRIYLILIAGFLKDMDLLNEQRSLIHTGKLLRQPDGVADELFVMLFDNYCGSLTS